MNIQRRSVRGLHVGIVATAMLLALTVNVQLRSNAVGAGTQTLTVSVGAPAAAFDPVAYVWSNFKSKVLDKVLDFIKKPIQAAKDGLQRLVDKAVEAIKKLFTENVLAPALTWALEKVFPKAEKILDYAKQLIGKVDHWVAVADKYGNAVDAMILGQAEKYSSIVGEANSSLDVIQRVNVEMIVNILIEVAKEKAGEFIKAKAMDLLNAAFKVVEGPIQIGKAAACTALGSVPIVGGLLRGAADFIITQGLVLLRDKGFNFIADEAVKLGDKAIDWIGAKLKGVAAKVDVAIEPVLNKVKGFIAQVAGYVAPLKNAFAKVKSGLAATEKMLAAAKSGAKNLAGKK